jgi:hypothetical protein
LGYLLVQSSPQSAAGGKEKYLRQLLAHFKNVWKIRALITLTDKDWAEINAFLAEYPEAKHQLCFWHALRAVKTRLAILRRAPAHYAVAVAHAEFDWIDTKFVPLSQLEEIDGDSVSFVLCYFLSVLKIWLGHLCCHPADSTAQYTTPRTLPLPSVSMARFETSFRDPTFRMQIIHQVPMMLLTRPTRKETFSMKLNTSWRRTLSMNRMVAQVTYVN